MFLVGALLRFGFVTAWLFHLVARMGMLGLLNIGLWMMEFSRLPHHHIMIMLYSRGSLMVLFVSSLMGLTTYSSSGCLGCDAKHKLTKSQTRSTSSRCMAEGVLTSGRCDVDNNAVHSLGTISSIDTLNPTHGTGDMSQDFINHGFLFWNESRQQWIGNNEKSNQGDQLRESRLSWNETYVSLLGSNKPFDMPVSLSEMVDFLVDVWEQEGMYD